MQLNTWELETTKLPHPFDFKTRNPRQIPSPAIIQAEHRQVNVNTHLDAYTIPRTQSKVFFPLILLWQDRWHLQPSRAPEMFFTLPIKLAFPPLCPSLVPVGASPGAYSIQLLPLSIGVFCCTDSKSASEEEVRVASEL